MNRTTSLYKNIIFLMGKLSQWFIDCSWSKKTNLQIGRHCKIADTVVFDTEAGGRITIGKETVIGHGVYIATYGGDIEIGENCNVNPYTIIYGHGNTKIGNNVLIAGHCMIIPNQHKFERIDITIRRQGSTSVGIEIEDDVWLGHGCSVLDGVRIATGCVIGAGCVVNKSISNNSIAAGVPVKIIGKRN